ncbi:hypothetical protein MHH56_27180 [Paenibacillus sp. FSL K6-3182]
MNSALNRIRPLLLLKQRTFFVDKSIIGLFNFLIEDLYKLED